MVFNAGAPAGVRLGAVAVSFVVGFLATKNVMLNLLLRPPSPRWWGQILGGYCSIGSRLGQDWVRIGYWVEDWVVKILGGGYWVDPNLDWVDPNTPNTQSKNIGIGFHHVLR